MRWAAPAVGAALVLLLAGCGGSGSGDGASAASSGAPGGDAVDMRAYADCLRANGATVPTGRPGGAGGERGADGARPSGAPGGAVRPSGRPTRAEGERPTGFPDGARPEARSTDPAYQKAEAACAKLRPQREGAGARPDAAPRNGGDSATQAFAGCLKDHQVELPTAGVAALDRSNAAVVAALKVCEALLPNNTPTASATSAPIG